MNFSWRIDNSIRIWCIIVALSITSANLLRWFRLLFYKTIHTTQRPLNCEQAEYNLEDPDSAFWGYTDKKENS